MDKFLSGTGIFYVIGLLYILIAWVVNLVGFIGLDFEPSYKLEIIKGIGVFIAPTSGVTVWF